MEEELIKKIKNVELPQVDLPSHRHKLKMALLKSDHFQKKQAANIFDLMKERMRTISAKIVLGRPVWQTAMAGMLVVVVIVVFSVALPSLLGQSKEALAAEITRNSLEVNAALGSDQMSEVEIIEIIDDMAIVEVHGVMGTTLTVEVDLLTKVVSEVIGGLQLTEEEKAEALNILGINPKFLELVAKGASVYAVLPMEVHFWGLNPETGELEEMTETWAQVWINLGEKQYGAQVDIIRGKVENISD